MFSLRSLSTIQSPWICVSKNRKQQRNGNGKRNEGVWLKVMKFEQSRVFRLVTARKETRKRDNEIKHPNFSWDLLIRPLT